MNDSAARSPMLPLGHMGRYPRHVLLPRFMPVPKDALACVDIDVLPVSCTLRFVSEQVSNIICRDAY